MNAVAQLVESLGLSMTCTEVGANPNMDSPMKGGSHWSCILRRDGHEMQVYFSQGAAFRRWREGGNRLNRTIAPRDIRATFSPVKGAFEKESLELREYRTNCTEPTPPTLDAVLDCLASDAQSYDNSRNFDEWCDEFGMDTDSRKAERTYRIIGEQAKALRHFLGNEHYDALLNAERL